MRDLEKRIIDLFNDLAFDADFEADIKTVNCAKKYVETFPQLKPLIAEWDALDVTISRDDLKAVYTMLKNRELHPCGTFDKQGRFYLDDAELVNVRAPSVKYPYSQMNAGRTAKFVKAMAHKYKAQNKNDLIRHFKVA